MREEYTGEEDGESTMPMTWSTSKRVTMKSIMPTRITRKSRSHGQEKDRGQKSRAELL